ncbi:MAG: FAD:protein FMN transferase [Tissierellia bacterium]|nr:FAD:protein FMN transferase [Tissierellia bacterium]
MEYESINFKALGTNIEIKILGKQTNSHLLACKNLVVNYHNMIMDFYKDQKALQDFNKVYRFKLSVHPEIFYMIDQAKKINHIDRNKLNILLGPLIDLWDFNSGKKLIPKKEEIQDLLPLTNPKNFSMDYHKKILLFTTKGMRIDLGALAKGYIADKLLDFLKRKKIPSALINLGGNIYCHGFNLERPDLYWHIGIQAPFKKRGQRLFKLKANDLSFVTSGIYERYFKIEDKIFHHILDPMTGYPIKSSMQSLTIISKSSLDAEIYSTGLFGMDFKLIQEEAKKNNFIAIAIYQEKTIKTSKDLSNYIVG